MSLIYIDPEQINSRIDFPKDLPVEFIEMLKVVIDREIEDRKGIPKIVPKKRKIREN